MKKEYRLLKNEDFKKVLDNHLGVSRETFKIFCKTNTLSHCRVGVSVSSKIGNSVIRHKIKRQVFNMVDKCVKLNDAFDFVIIVKSDYKNYTFNENYDILEKSIKYILKKGETINEK